MDEGGQIKGYMYRSSTVVRYLMWCQLDFVKAAHVIMHGSVFLSVLLASTDDEY